MSASKKILVIDDDIEMRSLMKDALEGDGYEVDTAADGEEALGKAARKSFDLMITDVRMPGLNGLDILPGLKKLQPKSSIIVVTAFGGDEVSRKALERGADAYLEKPIRLDELKRLLHQFISEKGKKKQA